jgi:hypothetical protein
MDLFDISANAFQRFPLARFAWRKSFRTGKSIIFHNSANCGNAILIVCFPCEIRNSPL